MKMGINVDGLRLGRDFVGAFAVLQFYKCWERGNEMLCLNLTFSL